MRGQWSAPHQQITRAADQNTRPLISHKPRAHRGGAFGRSLVAGNYAHRSPEMAKKFPIAPAHPERLCWGCDLYCPADDLRCGNGSDRTPHPCEFWGDDWEQLLEGTSSEAVDATPTLAQTPPHKL